MAWYWVVLIVVAGLALYFWCGVTSLKLAKQIGETLSRENGHFQAVFYLGPVFMLLYGPLYIAQRLGHTIRSDIRSDNSD